MKLSDAELETLFRVLKPYEVSDDWDRHEINRLAKLKLRIFRLMKRRGYDVDEDILAETDHLKLEGKK